MHLGYISFIITILFVNLVAGFNGLFHRTVKTIFDRPKTTERHPQSHNLNTFVNTMSIISNCFAVMSSSVDDALTAQITLEQTYSVEACNTHLRSYRAQCRMDPFNKAVTVHSLKYICNNDELLSIFLNLKAGPFPPNSKFKGHILACPSGACNLLELMIESLWSGKNVVYSGGSWPNDHGFVTNNILGAFNMFKAPFYRTIAPIDGKEALAIDYVNDLFLFILMDYVRKVQNNLYLGIVTLRPFFKTPFMYFILEIVD